jgi:oligosaccharyltransferase complex subunit epsilon
MYNLFHRFVALYFRVILKVKRFHKFILDTPSQLKIIDIYLIFLMLTGIIQFIHVLLTGKYPYYTFLAGFGSSVSSFVLAAGLRMQVNPENKGKIMRTPERAFADFLICSIVLHFFVVNFMGGLGF